MFHYRLCKNDLAKSLCKKSRTFLGQNTVCSNLSISRPITLDSEPLTNGNKCDWQQFRSVDVALFHHLLAATPTKQMFLFLSFHLDDLLPARSQLALMCDLFGFFVLKFS